MEGHHWDSNNTVGHNRKHVTKPHTRIHEVESGIECDSECSVVSHFGEHLDEEAAPTPDSPKKLVYPSQDIKNAPENLRGSVFCEVIRHPSYLVHTTDIGAETEIIHIGRKSHNECTVITMIGNRS